ncbi:MAG: methionyl-tRNA formyltransferase [bacterium]
MQKHNIIFFGTSSFAAHILDCLLLTSYAPSTIVTQPDKPQKRSTEPVPPPVKTLALAKNIPPENILQPARVRDEQFLQTLESLQPSLIIVAAYGQILPKRLLDIPPEGCLNVHASLLPKHRGASPIAATLVNDDPTTGVTIMLMDEGMDTGPILTMDELAINPTETRETLEEKLAELGARLLIKTIPLWIEKKITPKPQDNNQATNTKLLTRADGKINWNKTANEIECEMRAYTPWPGTWTTWTERKQQITIHTGKVLTEDIPMNTHTPGEVLLLPEKKLAIACGNGFFLPEIVQLAGKKATPIDEFIRGYINFIGGHLE